jgi:two-component system sensor histidine kinase LytS
MYLLLFERLSLNICLIITVAYLVSKTKLFHRTIRGSSTARDKILLIILFGCVGIIGSYIGFPIKGALANARVVGVVAGGLLGGPGIGLAIGFSWGEQQPLAAESLRF